ncbi:MAG TPA: YlqF/YawG family GTPase [Candidatus Eremiobacteraceae bacterium]|nr:YlqF/YawG family GTPase [Candidatus Eremiobacteraceae bacterium]
MPRSSAKDKAAASWFPGHMAAGMRALDEFAGLIDLVVEVRDARVPAATAVAGLHPKLRAKPRLIVLNREDLADPRATTAWVRALRAQWPAYATMGTNAATLRAVRTAIASAPRRRAVLHVAVVGAPNTGKSSVINGLSRRKRARAQDRPGVTRHAQWLALVPGTELLDTPGVLPPKIVDRDAAWQLAACGCLPETAYDPEAVVERLGAWLKEHGPAHAAARVSIEEFARARGMLRKGGEVDRAGAARTLLVEFRAGTLGRFTFELPREAS